MFIMEREKKREDMVLRGITHFIPFQLGCSWGRCESLKNLRILKARGNEAAPRCLQGYSNQTTECQPLGRVVAPAQHCPLQLTWHLSVQRHTASWGTPAHLTTYLRPSPHHGQAFQFSKQKSSLTVNFRITWMHWQSSMQFLSITSYFSLSRKQLLRLIVTNFDKAIWKRHTLCVKV